jgi:hypothetical protein
LRGDGAEHIATEGTMQDLLTVNIFAQGLLAALLGIGLFGLVLALPQFVNPDPRPEPKDADHGDPLEVPGRQGSSTP